MRKENLKRATCHPDLPHVAKGFCQKCYDHSRQIDPAIAPRLCARGRKNWRELRADPAAYANHLERQREYEKSPKAKAKRNIQRRTEEFRARRAELRALAVR